MMAMNVKQLNSGERVWLLEDGTPVNIDRAWNKSDKIITERVLDATLLKAASLDIVGDRQWFALRTVGISETDLCKVLTDSRVDAVVPVKKVQVKRRCTGAGRKVVHKPVLRGLVFVKIVRSSGAFAGLLRVRGVAGLVGIDKDRHEPYPISDRQMNGFMDLAQKGGFDERNTPTGLAIGCRVKIGVGPYAEFTGILEGYAKGRTARVMTWLFGHELTIDVKLAHLEKSE